MCSKADDPAYLTMQEADIREPQTEAGRTLLAILADGAPDKAQRGAEHLILEIEEQARAEVRASLAAQVRALRSPDRFVAMDGSYEQGVTEAAVLAILEASE